MTERTNNHIGIFLIFVSESQTTNYNPVSKVVRIYVDL